MARATATPREPHNGRGGALCPYHSTFYPQYSHRSVHNRSDPCEGRFNTRIDSRDMRRNVVNPTLIPCPHFHFSAEPYKVVIIRDKS